MITHRSWLRITYIAGVGYLREVDVYGEWFTVGVFATQEEASK